MRKGRKSGKKAKTDKEKITVTVTGKPAQLLQSLYESSGGKRSYSDILDEWSNHIKTPTDKLIKAINNLESICNTYFNPDTAKMVELLRPVIIQSTKGHYDPKAFKKTIMEFMESQNKGKG